ncbi:MAG: chloride channel protein [Archangium sp.]
MKKPEITSVAEGIGDRESLPIAPSLGPTLENEPRAPESKGPVDRRVVYISGLCILIALAAGLVARVLVELITLITNISFFGRVSFHEASPADNQLGLWVLVIPVLGALVVGVMARYGSKAIRGHGIPEAMEQVLFNRSRIPPRVTFLKPLSSAVAIGTGGPFGAEGPIIATGGAMGSFLGQLLKVTAEERKVLLAAGAGAGMAATFGAPVSAVLLAVELLLFEFRPRSVIPVALATSTATAVRMAFIGGAPAFHMPDVVAPSGGALAFYIVMGALIGVASVVATRAVYAIEDAFEKLPIHWMWWPALGALAVGVVGYFEPRTLGVGYSNIEAIISGDMVSTAALVFCLLKFTSWSIALGSGTSGGTLAPLFTIGGGLGSALGALVVWAVPGLGVDVRFAARVGMAAIFAGASRALLASVVFAFETTRQPMGLLPLLGGCSAAYLVSALLMRQSIMTEKLARRGSYVPMEYSADVLANTQVREHGLRPVVTLSAEDTLAAARAWLASAGAVSRHQGFPVVDKQGRLVGVVTRRELLEGGEAGEGRRVRELIRRPPAVVFEDSTLREAADHMVREDVGRLPVVRREEPWKVVGIITRSDLLGAHRKRLEEEHHAEQGIGGGKPPLRPGSHQHA